MKKNSRKVVAVQNNNHFVRDDAIAPIWFTEAMKSYPTKDDLRSSISGLRETMATKDELRSAVHELRETMVSKEEFYSTIHSTITTLQNTLVTKVEFNSSMESIVETFDNYVTKQEFEDHIGV